jgi:hypothetical protein
MSHAPREMIQPFEERIQKADEQFKKLTSECEYPANPVWDIENLNRETHWWLFRWSRK